MSRILYGKRWPEDFPFRFYIGSHTVAQTPAIPHLLRDMDGREMVRKLADAGVDALYMYACNGVTWLYPTEVEPGYLHPDLQGRDVFGEVADECAKRKIPFTGAYAGGLSPVIADRLPPDWQHYYPEARADCAKGVCWNTGWGEMLRKQIEEISRRYPMAGVFVDCLCYRGLVCCEGCARRFKEEVGVAPPRTEDLSSPLYKAFKIWVHRDEARYLRELREAVHSHQPEATFINNFHGPGCSEDWYEVADANDYLYYDPGIGFGYSRATVYLGALTSIFRAVSRGKPPFEFLADPIGQGLLSVIPTEPYAAITSMVSAQGGAVGPSTVVDHHGRINDASVSLTKEVSAFARARQPWRAEGEPVRFAGLYVSQESEMFYGGGDQKYLDEFHGAYLMLQQEHLPTDVLTRRDLSRLGEYPVIYLPNAVCMSDEEVEAFRKYVHQGGTLVSSYRTSLGNEWNEHREDFGLKDVLGVSYCKNKIEPDAKQLLQMPLPDGLFETEAWENRNLSLPQAALICQALPGAQVLVNLYDRYRNSPEIPDLYGPHAYMKETPEGPAVVENRYGKGRSIYFAGKIFSAYLFSGIVSLRKLAARWVIQDAVEDGLILRLKAPTSVEMTAWAQPDRDRLLVHLVNYQSAPGRLHLPLSILPDTEEVLPVHDLTLATSFAIDDVLSARLQPAGDELVVHSKDGKAVISIPQVHIHEIVEIVLKPGVYPQYPDSNRDPKYPRYDLRKKVQEWLATKPPEYDPNDDGILSFENWLAAEDFLTNWNFVGPFPCQPGKALETVYGPEEDPSLDATYEGLDGAELTWIDYSGTKRHRVGFIDLFRAVGSNPNMVGYAMCYLKSAQAQEVRFWVGGDDACKILVNNVEHYSDQGSREPDRRPDKAMFEVELAKGNNLVLVKSVGVGHGMGFYLRIENPNSEIICSSSPEGPGREVGSKHTARE